MLKARYGRGLYFVISGDFNHLKYDQILSLDTKFTQIVKQWTRLDPPAILDPVIMTMSDFYQDPVCLNPLDPDDDKKKVKNLII